MYDHKTIEKKWQKYWEENKTYKTETDSNKEKFYTLVEFPYPSGAGVHVGHVKGQTAVDIFARYKRMNGYNVLNAMGWDAFGLPAENFAIKNKKHPNHFTQENIKNFRRQIKSFGPSFDWDREIDTTDPKYYKWTQWIFLKLFEMGLAYEKEAPINWCPSCKTGLANEEVIDGKCERCDSVVEQKNMKQWFLKITNYADKLINDLKDLNWPEYIKTSQKNWIGRSEGAEIKFDIENSDKKINVFTTRIDTIFGCTYVVLAPENILVEGLKNKVKNWEEVNGYIKKIKNKSDLERTDLNKEKSGIKLDGIKAINLFNQEKVDIFIADYVLSSYGTGAVMAVPAHDERDFEFAQKYNIEIKTAILPENKKESETCYTEDGVLIDSGEFTGLQSLEAREKMVEKGERGGFAKKKINYKLRDWLFSRQRYWGEPIPIIKCLVCGNVPISENELPLLLPEVENYEPSGTGESPLSKIDSWVNVKCPKCGGEAKRETNTMPQWAGSSWYFLRYIDPHNDKELASQDNLKYFMPVDVYFGGAEHTTVHLLYSRFWNKALYEKGIVPVSEPYKRRVQHGLILAEDGKKMSKRWGNVINPDDVIAEYGADVMRVYIMFMGPYGDTSAWSTSAINGIGRFINKIWSLSEKEITEEEADRETLNLLHKTIKKIGEDIENISFHTAISQMMIFLNHLLTKKDINRNVFSIFIKLLVPFTPHLSEELYQKINPERVGSVCNLDWPIYDSNLIKDEKAKIAIQVNGKLRDEIEVDFDSDQKVVEELARERSNVKKHLEGKELVKIIFIKNKLINIVVR
ncbi:leucine--tRNA ligase [Candidatus Falkowbacteria bacterium HGW-Falkowbacteria-1]|uniref:Leucine--tRNA ligase n=1 Tax=Candidatus Falkowbacteria bacterium HGW-Falkowbacteria-1 TaxID=2013768 RepID=A0A2N2E8T9_9BACT|nr:MAG: leucine--tRNA ligase [Candidatus Falkowbacteria bacterium HGW-Falkowbacteria-1]